MNTKREKPENETTGEVKALKKKIRKLGEESEVARTSSMSVKRGEKDT